MANFMAVVKLSKSTFEEWKQGMDEDAEMTQMFMRDVMIGKVDDYTAIVSADVFDPELQQQYMSDQHYRKWQKCMEPSIHSI